MLRRPNIEEPVSRLAAWSSRLALFALAAAALSIVVVRGDLLEIVPAMATFGAALALAALAILLALAAAVVIWREGLRGIGRAAAGFVLGCALLAYPAYLAALASQLPAIRDITTDTAQPPRFDVISRLRPRGTNDYRPADAARQRDAYPDIMPLQVLATPAQAYAAALAVAKKHKWTIVDARPPAPRRDGTVEAVARTFIMGFRDDVAIRIKPMGTGAKIDIRSASRYGSHDFGTNAARVRMLLEEIDDAASGEVKLEPERRPEPRPERRPATGQPARR
jgi:uncharacterized protein (DUF1499 family)